MKQYLKIFGISTLALSLVHCASFVTDQSKVQKDGTRKIIGKTDFSRSPADCPNGLIFAAAWHDTLSGNEVYFKSAAALSTEQIDEKYDLYVLARLKHPKLDPDVDYKKVPMTAPFPSMTAKFLDQKVADGSMKAFTDVDAMMKHKIGAEIPVPQKKPNSGIYFGEGILSTATLTSNYFEDKQLVQSFGISADGGKTYQYYNLPMSVMGPAVDEPVREDPKEEPEDKTKKKEEEKSKGRDSDKKDDDEKTAEETASREFSEVASADVAEDDDADKEKEKKVKDAPTGTELTDFFKGISIDAGAELTINIQPSDQPSAILLMMSNDKPHGESITYLNVTKQAEGQSAITVPLTDVEPGTYYGSVLRVVNSDATINDLDVCVDIASGVRTLVNVKEKAEAKK